MNIPGRPGMYARQIASAVALSLTLSSSIAQSDEIIKSSTVLGTSTSWTGQKIEYPKMDSLTITSRLLELQPGPDTGWHTHPSPPYVYVLEGAMLVEDDEGNKKELHAGEAAVEVQNYHHGMNRGSTPAKLLLVFIGQEGQPLTVMRHTP
jgi:quercetin dioxygenase-like cupin family protein